MAMPVAGGLHKADLAHGTGQPLVPSGVFHLPIPSDRYYLNGTRFSAHIVDDNGLEYFLESLLNCPMKTSTVCMYLKPEDYQPQEPEWPPSNMYFDVDRERQLAAIALLAFDKQGNSHQWLTQGEAGRDDVTLIMDPWNPEFKRFPTESVITIAQLRGAVREWAFGDILPPPSLNWRSASEAEVGWQ